MQAKCEIFENLQPGGLAVLNGDDELLSGLTLPFETVLCGQHKRCGVRVANVAEHGIDGVTCTVTTVRDVYEVSIPSPGAYMIYPAAMAIAIGEHLGLTKAEMLAGIAAYRPVGSRMHLVRCSNDRIIIDDCYNANPQAMAEALRILAQEADPDALWFPTVTEALPAIRAAFTAGTAVLVKASHAMHFTDIVKDLEATE